LNDHLVLVVSFLLAVPKGVPSAYKAWTHTGRLHLLTTPDGANLPASARVAGYPLLVRLHDNKVSVGGPLARQYELKPMADRPDCEVDEHESRPYLAFGCITPGRSGP